MALDTETREQVGAIMDVLLGDNDGHGGRLQGAIREQLEPQLAEKLEPIKEQLATLNAAAEQGPPGSKSRSQYPPPPWAAPSGQIAHVLGAPDANWHNPDAAGAELDGKFGSFAEFVRAVILRDMKGVQDPRLVSVSTNGDISAALTGEEIELGGALVPEEFRPTLLSLQLQMTSIRQRATVLPMGSSAMSIPAIRDADHRNGQVFGGVSFDWLEVNDEIQGTEPEFKQVRLNARALAGRTDIPNTLIEDSFTTVPSLIMSLWQQAVPWIEESVFIRGDGVGKPLGILNSDAAVTVGRETVREFNVSDIFEMIAHLLPGSLGRAVWMYNPELIKEIGTLTNGETQVWMPNLATGMPGSIAGIPAIPNEHMSALGVAGDMVLVDWMYYLIADRQALSMAASAHQRFSNNITVMRGIERLDGQPWLDTPITPAQGSTDYTLSPFVILGATARA